MKESPILVVNKPRKKRPAASKKKSSSSRKKSSKRKKHTSKEMPRWLFYVLSALIILLFAVVFYYFFIKPYAYRWKPCYGCREYGVCMPYGYQVHGIDISHFQGDIDWSLLKENQSENYPLKFVFVKATEGGDLNDDTFNKNFASARKHGFIRGAYHFYNPSTPALRQADFFINTVKLDSGDLPPVLDIELKGKKEPEELKKDLKIWLDKVERHYKVKPILYTSYKFKMRYLNDSVFNSYPYWIAHYYVDSVRYEGAWQFWQHTDVGSIPGIPKNLDLNIFNGTLQELVGMTIKSGR